jgi:hypothetical protein
LCSSIISPLLVLLSYLFDKPESLTINWSIFAVSVGVHAGLAFALWKRKKWGGIGLLVFYLAVAVLSLLTGYKTPWILAGLVNYVVLVVLLRFTWHQLT